MATLAEQHRDDIQSKDESNILNASESDVHISTQQSINEVDRLRPNLNNIVPATSSSSIKERNDAAQNVDSYRAPKISNQKPSFVLSSRVEFDEGSLFSAARKDMTSKENQGEPTTNERKPSTPLSKKAKYIFKRTFDATFKPSDICGTDIILASDSENDETD